MVGLFTTFMHTYALLDSRDVSREQLTNFLEEATIMKDFEHPNVLSLIGVVADGPRVFVVLPFMEFGDLGTHVSTQV